MYVIFFRSNVSRSIDNSFIDINMIPCTYIYNLYSNIGYILGYNYTVSSDYYWFLKTNGLKYFFALKVLNQIYRIYKFILLQIMHCTNSDGQQITAVVQFSYIIVWSRSQRVAALSRQSRTYRLRKDSTIRSAQNYYLII